MSSPTTFVSGVLKVVSLIGQFSLGINTKGPQSAVLPLTGGTFVANGASVVTVVDTNVDAGSNIIITLNTPGGTVGAIPAVQTKTAGVGFTVAGTASDTSTYNYLILA